MSHGFFRQSQKHTQWTVSNERNPQFSTGIQQPKLFDFKGEGAVFELDGVDVVDFTGSTKCIGGYFGEPDILDFAFAEGLMGISKGLRRSRRVAYFFSSTMASIVFSMGVFLSTRWLLQLLVWSKEGPALGPTNRRGRCSPPQASSMTLHKPLCSTLAKNRSPASHLLLPEPCWRTWW